MVTNAFQRPTRPIQGNVFYAALDLMHMTSFQYGAPALRSKGDCSLVDLCAFWLFRHRLTSKMAAGWRQCIRSIHKEESWSYLLYCLLISKVHVLFNIEKFFSCSYFVEIKTKLYSFLMNNSFVKVFLF